MPQRQSVAGGSSSGGLDPANNLSDLTSAASARANLDLEPGVDVQAYDAELAALAGLTSAADKLPYFNGSGTAAVADLTAAGRELINDADAAAQRTTLGLGTIATQAANNVTITGGSISGITDLPIADGGTGASDAATAFANLKQAASDTATGVVELATSAETTTGTDAARAVTPDGLAGSVYGKRIGYVTIADPATTPTTGDSKYSFLITSEMNGWNLVGVAATVTTVSSSGTPTFAIRRERSGSAVDMLSTNITIDANEKTSYTATTTAVINSSNDDLATGDILLFDLDVVGTGAKGHQVVIIVQAP